MSYPTYKPLHLKMELWSGRADPEHPMDGYGFDGPVMHDILALFYSRGNMVLELDQNSDIDGIKRLTGWQSKQPIPFPRELFHFESNHSKYLCIRQHRDAILSRVVSDSDGDEPQIAFYGSFGIYRQDSWDRLISDDERYKPMSLRLSLGTRPEVEVPDLTLEDISSLSFDDGTLIVWFNSPLLARHAKAKTGWRSGKDELRSLIMKVDPYQGAIQADGACFKRFLLTVDTHH